MKLANVSSQWVVGMGIIEDGDFKNNAIQISEDGVMENDENFENDMIEMLRDD